MNLTRIGVTLAWGLAGWSIFASLGEWSRALPRHSAAGVTIEPSWRSTIDSSPPVDSLELATAASGIRERNPFRWDRRPTGVLFNPWEPVAPPITNLPATPPKPSLSLSGVVGGPPWAALIEGIPGREGGVLLNVGQEAGGVQLRELVGNVATLTGFDTTWVLTPRQAWH